MKSKNFSRRDFIQKGTLASIAASTKIGSSFGQANSSLFVDENALNKINYPSSATKKLTALLKIKYPIIQAPTGGVVSSELTAAVSNSGGLGAIPVTWTKGDALIKKIKDVQFRTNFPFFCNYVLDMEPKTLGIILKAGVKIIQFSWGMPKEKEIKLIKSYDAIMGIQVCDASSAKMAIKLGADYLVCQGMEAGGHVQGSRPLAKALERVLQVSGDIPVVVSGGIATGHKMREYMQMGAAGVIMGSRFVATLESSAHQDYKDSLVKATADDTVYTVCMSKNWPNATHRIIRNTTFDMWEEAGNPPEGQKPGEDDIIAIASDFKVKRYEPNAPNKNYKGDIEAMANYAGEGVDDIDDIPTVTELIERIWKEFLNK
ncbi:MAG: nitronate monooxygenase [Maribacter sp.]|nr:nitronate monooxygenase [Maribacter sp.]